MKQIDQKTERLRSVSRRRRHGQRGSALLVVLVFAAIIGIMLYRELPIAAFEAQRQKEELLVSRGNEYKRGVKLFVRKIGRFPSTLDELENTNRMRFLRHRFVDPMTGKDDWRMIHAGPGGVIIDSKVATTTNTKNQNALGQGATFAGFNNSFSGDTASAAANAADNATSAGMRQRPPATKNAGDAANPDPLAAVAGAGSSTDPNNPNSATIDPATGQPVPGNAANNPANAVTSLADQLNNTNPKTPVPVTNPAQNGGLGNTSSFGSTATSANLQNGVVGNQGSNQITAAGGIAGVASNAEGKSIKLVHDQKKYKFWEFYYDMKQEQQAGAVNGVTAANGVGVTAVNPALANSNGFGQTQSSFGGSSSFGSSSQTPVTGSINGTPPPSALPQSPQ